MLHLSSDRGGCARTATEMYAISLKEREESRQWEPWGRHGSKLNEIRETLGKLMVFCILNHSLRVLGEIVCSGFSCP